MLTLLSGLGLMFVIAVLMMSVYVIVAIIELSKDEQLSGVQTAIAITQFVLAVAFGLVLLTLFGWLLIKPLMPALLICG